MKYLDILKNFDKAIVTESRKLQLIYENLCEGKDVEDVEDENDGETQPENQTDGPVCQYENDDPQNSDGQNSNGQRKGGLLNAEEFFADVNGDSPNVNQDDSKETAETPEPDASEDTEETPVPDASEETAEPTEPEASEETEEPKAPEEQQNESSRDAREALRATCFEDEEPNSKDKPEDPTKNATEDTAEKDSEETAEVETKPKEVETKPKTESKKPDKNDTLADWLEDHSEVNETEEDHSEEDHSEENPKKCERCQNYPCTCEKDAEEKALQESIKNITAFVQANKRLFVVE